MLRENNATTPEEDEFETLPFARKTGNVSPVTPTSVYVPPKPRQAAPDDDAGLSMSLELSRSINDGNYGSAKVSIRLSGIQPGTTQEDIDEMLDGAAVLAYGSMRKKLASELGKFGIVPKGK